MSASESARASTLRNWKTLVGEYETHRLCAIFDDHVLLKSSDSSFEPIILDLLILIEAIILQAILLILCIAERALVLALVDSVAVVRLVLGHHQLLEVGEGRGAAFELQRLAIGHLDLPLGLAGDLVAWSLDVGIDEVLDCVEAFGGVVLSNAHLQQRCGAVRRCFNRFGHVAISGCCEGRLAYA